MNAVPVGPARVHFVVGHKRTRMDKKEAQLILGKYLAQYRKLSYAELASRVRDGRVDTPEAVGESGTDYQIEIQFFWDSRPDGDVRVFGSIDDGRAPWCFSPLTDSFILSPEGRFVDE